MPKRTMAGLWLATLASPVAAQTVPASADGYVEASPEAMGMTPEQFAATGIKRGSRVRITGPAQDAGLSVYDGPVSVAAPGSAPGREMSAAPGAVVLRSVVRFDEQHWVSPQPIRIGEPFGVTLPAGTEFASMLKPSGNIELCVAPKPGPFTPVQDRSGAIYPQFCLEQLDSSGRYRTIRLLPYLTSLPDQRVQVDPIALNRAASPEAFAVDTLFAMRRVRIDAVDATGVHLILEDAGYRMRDAHSTLDTLVPIQDYRKAGEALLPLSPGASATLGGATFTLQPTGSGWTITAAGAFAPFALLTANGAGFRFTRPQPQ